jgi:integrase
MINDLLNLLEQKRKYTIPKLYVPKKIKNGIKVPDIGKSKRWYVYYTYSGKFIKHYNGLNSFKNISDRKKVGKAMVDTYSELLRLGWSPLDLEYHNGKSVVTLETGILNALKLKKHTVKQSTFSQYETAAHQFLDYCKDNLLAGKPVDQVNGKDIVGYINYIIQKGNNPTSVNNNKRVLSALFSKLKNDFVIKVNPVVGIKSSKNKPIKNDPFNSTQIKEIVDYCTKNDPYLLKFISFIVFALLRPVEITRIRIKDIENDFIRLETKTNDRAYIQIVDKLRGVIDLELAKGGLLDDFLFSKKEIPAKWITDREKSRVDFFTRRFLKVKKALNLGSQYGLYSFRHSAIYSLYQSFLNEDLSHNEIIIQLLPITRHSSEKELTAYLRNIGSMLPKDYGNRFDFDL